MPLGSLYSVLHEGRGIPVVDHAAILNFAVDIARGMKFLHDLQRSSAPRFNLNTRHVVIDEDQRARINLSDSHFSVLGNDKVSSFILDIFLPVPLSKDTKKCLVFCMNT